MRIHSAALILLALAGCASAPKPVRIVVPEIVRVPVREYVSVPPALTKPCPVAELKSRTVEAVVAAANARKLALEQCNKQLSEIRGLGSP